MAPLLASKPDEDILCEASTTATSDFRACLGTNAAEDVASTASPSVLPQINTERLWNDIHNTARWGALSNSTGVSRLALSDEDRCVRNWFVKEAKILGCEVNVDEMGNIFAVLVGTDHTIAPIGIGSHLDTQPSGIITL
jgi:N-carbamoyl-L-amino-acid hydrolase